MPLMKWNEEMSVGVQSMDDDHKKLIDLLNEMHEGLAAGLDREALGAIIERLIEYTRIHLRNEERLLADADYPAPNSSEHHKEHDQMIATALKAQANFRCGSNEMLTIEMLTFLQNWLNAHIMGTDKLYGPYLNSRGIH